MVELGTQLEWMEDQTEDEEMKPMITGNYLKFSYIGAMEGKEKEVKEKI